MKQPNLEMIFAHFSNFVTQFEIEGQRYGSHERSADDEQIQQWNRVYPLEGKRVLELGSRDSGSTLLLHHQRAAEVVSIVATLDAYLKGCVVKNIYSLDICQFVFENFQQLDLAKYGRFDVVICHDMLDRVDDPFDLLCRIAEISEQVCAVAGFAPAASVVGREAKLMTSHPFRAGKFSYNGRRFADGGKMRFLPFYDDLHAMIRDVGLPYIEVLYKTEGTTGKPSFCLLYANASTPTQHSAETDTQITILMGQIIGKIDIPADHALLQGKIVVQGWALSDTDEPLQFQFRLNERHLPSNVHRLPRKDIEQAFPELAKGHPEPGYASEIDLAGMAAGIYELSVIAWNSQLSRYLGKLSIQVTR